MTYSATFRFPEHPVNDLCFLQQRSEQVRIPQRGQVYLAKLAEQTEHSLLTHLVILLILPSDSFMPITHETQEHPPSLNAKSRLNVQLKQFKLLGEK